MQVWTTNEWLQGSFIDSGVNVPVSVVRIGTRVPVLDVPWHLSPRGDGFTFLAVGTLIPRKALLELAQAFLAEFGEDEGVLLRVHSKWGEEEVMISHARTMRSPGFEAHGACVWSKAPASVRLCN